MAEALYRKYRPQVFADVVGQEPIERTLKNAIEQDKVSHAYLFCGPRGTGKTTTARLLAKALLCQTGPTPEPDGTCEDCRLIADGVHPDVYELDAASRTGVENVREEIISRVQFAPTRGRFKIYIIDEVHMLSTAAFNALLKTLEEPPSHVVFILCTTDPQKVPETIHSRCQRFDFRRIAPENMVSRLGAICVAEGVEFEGEALDLIAHRAEGGLRNALTSLEQIIAFENGKVTLAGAERLLGSIDSNDMAEVMAFIGQRDIANCFRWTANYVETGADLAQFVRDMGEHVRNLYVLALAGDEVELDVSETMRRELTTELQWFGPDRASRMLGVLGDLAAELRTTSNPRLAFEIALTRMVRPDSDLTLEALAERVEALESGYSSVAHVLPGAPASEFPRERETVAAAPQPAAMFVESEPAQQEAAAVAPQAADVAAPTSAVVEAPAEQEPVAAAAVVEEAAPAQAESKAAALANPAALQRIWQAVMTTVKKEKQAYGVLFMNTKAEFDEAADELRVLFPAESSFAFKTAQKAEVQDTLAAALEKAVGQLVPFRYEQMGGGATTASVAAVTPAVQPQPAPEPQPQPQPQVTPESQPQPAPEPEPQPQPQPASEPEPEPQPAPVPEPQPEPAPQPEPQCQAGGLPVRNAPSVEQSQSSYEQVPYEDIPYEEVPYEDLAMPQQAPSQTAPSQATPAPSQATGPASASAGDIPDDAQDVQALLQAGFGGNVVFSEIDE